MAPIWTSSFYASESSLRVRASKPETWQGERLMRTTTCEYLWQAGDARAGVDRRPTSHGLCGLFVGADGDADGVRDFIAALRAERRKRIQRASNRSMSSSPLMNSLPLSRNILHKENDSAQALEPISGRYSDRSNYQSSRPLPPDQLPAKEARRPTGSPAGPVFAADEYASARRSRL